MAYWWSLKNNRVEQGSKLGWFHGQRLGPYDTEEQAPRRARRVRGAQQAAGRRRHRLARRQTRRLRPADVSPASLQRGPLPAR